MSAIRRERANALSSDSNTALNTNDPHSAFVGANGDVVKRGGGVGGYHDYDRCVCAFTRRKYKYIYIHVCIYTHIHTYIYMYIYIHINDIFI